MADEQESTAGGDVQEARVAAVQAAVDRVTSWQEGATRETVRAELEKALAQAGAEVPDDFVDRVVEHVHAGGEHVDVEPLLRQEPDRR